MQTQAPLPRAPHSPAPALCSSGPDSWQKQQIIPTYTPFSCEPQESPGGAPKPCSLFSRRWRLFRPLALGTRSEFRTAWWMKCCFRLEADSLFTWEPARAGRQPGRGLWAGLGWGGRPQGRHRPGPPGRTPLQPLYHSHHLLGFPQQRGALWNPRPFKFHFVSWSHHPGGPYSCDDRLVNWGPEKRRHFPKFTSRVGGQEKFLPPPPDFQILSASWWDPESPGFDHRPPLGVSQETGFSGAPPVPAADKASNSLQGFEVMPEPMCLKSLEAP